MFRTITKITSDLALVAAVFAFACPVQASVITFHTNAYTPSIKVSRTVDGVNFSTTELGYFTITRTGGDFTTPLVGPFPNASQFIAWCIEPKESLGLNKDYTYNVSQLASGTTNIGGMGALKAQQLNDLFGLFYPDFRQPITDLQGAALQAAVWEIVREPLNTTQFYVFADPSINQYPNTNPIPYTVPGLVQFKKPVGLTAPQEAFLQDALFLAQSYLDEINAGQHAQPLFQTLALTKVGAQDIIVQDLPVPEPESLALFAIGGVALAASRRRRKTTANS
jgi:PEP-CTERM motif